MMLNVHTTLQPNERSSSPNFLRFFFAKRNWENLKIPRQGSPQVSMGARNSFSMLPKKCFTEKIKRLSQTKNLENFTLSIFKLYYHFFSFIFLLYRVFSFHLLRLCPCCMCVCENNLNMLYRRSWLYSCVTVTIHHGNHGVRGSDITSDAFSAPGWHIMTPKFLAPSLRLPATFGSFPLTRVSCWTSPKSSACTILWGCTKDGKSPWLKMCLMI